MVDYIYLAGSQETSVAKWKEIPMSVGQRFKVARFESVLYGRDRSPPRLRRLDTAGPNTNLPDSGKDEFQDSDPRSLLTTLLWLDLVLPSWVHLEPWRWATRYLSTILRYLGT